jgi:hypothetical protein
MIFAAVESLLLSVSSAATPITSTDFKVTPTPADAGGGAGGIDGPLDDCASDWHETASTNRPNTGLRTELVGLRASRAIFMPRIMVWQYPAIRNWQGKHPPYQRKRRPGRWDHVECG